MKKEEILTAISRIREDIGHEDIQPDIIDIIFNDEKSELLIITSDRPEKSLVIGKGGWVVGKLKEDLKINKIHVESYLDLYIRKNRMELALHRLEEVIDNYDILTAKPLLNLWKLLKKRIEFPYNIEDILEENQDKEQLVSNNNTKAIVALSGGVDSSFALIIAYIMGFNPLAVTVNPGDIILPKYFRERVENLTESLGVDHQYLEVDMSSVIEGALEGRYHPCGRCSKVIEKTVLEYAQKKGVPFIIFGDLLATGSQSLTYKGDLLRINLPAMLAATKGETKALSSNYGVSPTGRYGCPLLVEVIKKYNHMNRYSVQRVLRETRAGLLEPGEALDMVMSLFRNK
ncbi:MAG: ATPase [Methanobacterium sp.]|nr:ATPase [Methanobacterium sp.]